MYKMLFTATKPQFDAVEPRHTLKEVSFERTKSVGIQSTESNVKTLKESKFQAAMEFTSKDVRCICT